VNEYHPETYGHRIADDYDDLWGAVDPDMIPLLSDMDRAGRVLELGVGTGRVALPLAATGLEVYGMDVSEAMVARLRAKPGGSDLPVVIGDFADVAVDGTFSLIFASFNTLFLMLTQEDQVRCIRNVAQHLTEDGVFVIEAFVPNPTRFVQGQSVRTRFAEVDRVSLDLSMHDPVSQRVVSQDMLGGRSPFRVFGSW